MEDPELSEVRPVAVLIPVWNRQAKLERALGSIVGDSSLIEVVVVDDGSEPPVRIPPSLPFEVRLIRLRSNGGIAAALNAGLAYVFERGHPYVARLDSDDVAVEGRFARQFAFMERDGSIGICGGGYHEHGQDGRLVGTVIPPCDDRGIRRGMHLRTTLWHPTVMIRTAVARRVGFFDTTLVCEDIDYFLKVLDVSRAANLPEPLILYETGSADALTGTASRRRALALDLLRIKWRRRCPADPLWWLGVLAAVSYFLGINRPLRRCQDRLVGWLGKGRT